MTMKDRQLVAIPGIVPESYDRYHRAAGLQTAAPIAGQKCCDQPTEIHDRDRANGHLCVRCMLAEEKEKRRSMQH